ncbi:G-box-binding factor 1 isoform X1 [Cucumis melo var. makuwa]|uniref:G-box-binding factor 1 isoform X1 n=1 Tax=Cucumis melo var. makuwa TaxID=1194695 RepID=A0A5D3BIS2_CUCMM|nr:G-box-binding factor 1 isoform X1 [Cucumis melo var. makuwa]
MSMNTTGLKFSLFYNCRLIIVMVLLHLHSLHLLLLLQLPTLTYREHPLMLPYGTLVLYPAIYPPREFMAIPISLWEIPSWKRKGLKKSKGMLGNTASAGGRKSGKVASSSGNDGAFQRCFNLRLGAGWPVNEPGSSSREPNAKA